MNYLPPPTSRNVESARVERYSSGGVLPTVTRLRNGVLLERTYIHYIGRRRPRSCRRYAGGVHARACWSEDVHYSCSTCRNPKVTTRKGKAVVPSVSKLLPALSARTRTTATRAALAGFVNLKLCGLYAIRETCCYPGIGRDGYGKGARRRMLVCHYASADSLWQCRRLQSDAHTTTGVCTSTCVETDSGACRTASSVPYREPLGYPLGNPQCTARCVCSYRVRWSAISCRPRAWVLRQV